jgi:hypothetical protein
VAEQKVYRIRHKQTGLYSLGGHTPNWSKSGKVWRSMGALRNHLRVFNQGPTGYGNRAIPADWLVIEYILREDELAYYPAADLLLPKSK